MSKFLKLSLGIGILEEFLKRFQKKNTSIWRFFFKKLVDKFPGITPCTVSLKQIPISLFTGFSKFSDNQFKDLLILSLMFSLFRLIITKFEQCDRAFAQNPSFDPFKLVAGALEVLSGPLVTRMIKPTIFGQTLFVSP